MMTIRRAIVLLAILTGGCAGAPTTPTPPPQVVVLPGPVVYTVTGKANAVSITWTVSGAQDHIRRAIGSGTSVGDFSATWTGKAGDQLFIQAQADDPVRDPGATITVTITKNGQLVGTKNGNSMDVVTVAGVF